MATSESSGPAGDGAAENRLAAGRHRASLLSGDNYRRPSACSTSLALCAHAWAELSGRYPIMILTVTPNVALDRTLRVPGFTAGGVWRARDVHTAAGGKGLNVARALLRLGRPARCTGLVGGDAGRQVAMLAEAERLSAHWTWIVGETRTSVIVVGDGGQSTVINEPGPLLADAEWARFVDDVATAASECRFVCISGSLPAGCPPGGLARLIAAAGAERVWVDTSGPALAEAVAVAPFGIKINGEEAQALLGSPIRNPREAIWAAHENPAARSKRRRDHHGQWRRGHGQQRRKLAGDGSSDQSRQSGRQRRLLPCRPPGSLERRPRRGRGLAACNRDRRRQRPGAARGRHRAGTGRAIGAECRCA